ncbi:hypothetical protein SESBI_44652 [Sesbania bispinosa]|nr:hypothetical protein SESBI_44652 [Sesbania bispinosa]
MEEFKHDVRAMIKKKNGVESGKSSKTRLRVEFLVKSQNPTNLSPKSTRSPSSTSVAFLRRLQEHAPNSTQVIDF